MVRRRGLGNKSRQPHGQWRIETDDQQACPGQGEVGGVKVWAKKTTKDNNDVVH